jgi:hypothetical protein
MYRLRELYDGENADKKQKVVFVVCGVETPVDGDALYAQLVKNEHIRKARLDKRTTVHLKRAQIMKSRQSDFVFPVQTSADLQQEQEQEQEQEHEHEHENEQKQKSNSCVHVDRSPYYLDPFVMYDEQDYEILNFKVSNLHSKLRETHLYVSPLLMSNFVGGLERAFAVLGSAAQPTVVVCMQIEAFGEVLEHKPLRQSMSVYLGSGVLVRGDPVDAGLVLFGRYLCGDDMAQKESRDLLEFLKERYRGKEGALNEVLRCLVDSRVIRQRVGALDIFHQHANWHTMSIEDPPEAAFVDSILRMTTFGKRTFV